MADPSARRAVGRWRLVTIVLIITTLALLAAVIVVAIKLSHIMNISVCGNSHNSKVGHINLRESDNPSVFHDLTTAEISGLMQFLHLQKDLNLVKSADMVVNSSYVYLSDLHIPNKVDVLNYLDNEGKQPQREAHVIIFRGDKAIPDVEEYLVGPLPNPTSLKPVPYRPRSIPFLFRPVTGPEHGRVIEMLTTKTDAVLGQMFEDTYGGRLLNCGNKCVIIRYITPVAPVLAGEKVRKTWYWLSQFADYFILHPLNFAILVNQDTPDFKIEKVWFDDKLYKTLEDVLDFYNANKGTVQRVKFPEDNPELFSSMNQRGTAPLDPPLRNPMQVSPDGKRYNIHDRHIEYMFWQFDIRMSAIRGPQLYDIRFKNERIAYELSLQEISVFYAGSKPMQALANYMDSIGLIGIQAKMLVPGIDCPQDATFLSTTFQVESDEAFSFENAFCVFEYNTGMPLRRHQSYSYNYGRFYEGMESTVLIVRTIPVIVNYDYIIDFIFHQNGAIQVKVVSTGYILANYYTGDESKYSFKLHDHLAANIHQHLFNFKADLDIKGTSNRFATANFETENIANKFSVDPNDRLVQQKFSMDLKRTEKAAAYKYNFETPKYLLVYNEEDRIANGYSQAKSYRILNKGMAKQILPENIGNEVSISWARYQVAITKHNESEPTSSSVYSGLDSQEPVVNFQSFIGNDDIVDKDLVAWITMGIHHIPHTEDLPVTPTPGMELSFYITPYNYFSEDPAIASLNAVRIEPKEKLVLKTSVNINRYGVKEKVQCLPEDALGKFDKATSEHPERFIDTTGGGII